MTATAPSSILTKLTHRLRERAPRVGDSVATQRENFEVAVAPMALADGVTVDAVSADGVPAEWLTPPGAPPRGTVLYLHGGGYVIGSLNTIRPMASHLAVAGHARVLAIDYRLAPEHAHPAAVEDAVDAYEWLLRTGHRPEQVAVGGDSAGGGLTFATLVALRDAGLPQPAGAVGLSPWTDLTAAGASLDSNAATDPQVQRWLLEEMAAHYLAGQDGRTPLASPRFADLRGLAPLLIHVGGAEALLDDAREFAEVAKAAGNDVTLECWEHMIHVWHAFAPILPEANAALQRVGEWLQAQWPAVGADGRPGDDQSGVQMPGPTAQLAPSDDVIDPA